MDYPRSKVLNDMMSSNNASIRKEGYRLDTIEAAKHYVSMSVSALATLRDRCEDEDVKAWVQKCLDQLSSVQWLVGEIK